MGIPGYLQKNSSKKIVSLLVLSLVMGGFLFVSPENIFANNNRHQHMRHQPHHNRHVMQHHQARGAIFHVGSRHFFRQRVFHRRHFSGYIIINFPIGLHVDILPHGHRRLLFERKTYYHFNNTYYSKVDDGYIVVENPRYRMVFPPIDATIYESNGEYLVNLANSNGTYTAITIKKFGTGYIGPQGEYYPDFPSVDQLSTMYGN